jgi:hypothetical protein
MNLEVGKLYISDKSFLIATKKVLPKKFPYVTFCDDENNAASLVIIYKTTQGLDVFYIAPHCPILILEKEGSFVKVLVGEQVAWIDWMAASFLREVEKKVYTATLQRVDR